MPTKTLNDTPALERESNREYMCLSGSGCFEYAVESTMFPGVYRFCREHQAQLDDAREDMEARAHQRSNKNKSGVKDVFCARDNCTNRPVYGSSVCHDHMTEDDDVEAAA